MHGKIGRGSTTMLLVTLASLLLPALARAHPGTGIVVDGSGNVYFVDMVSGVWRLDARGGLTHMPGPGFHWMTLDAGDRFASTRLPSGSGGDIARIGAHPTLLLGSDVPIALGRDGSLYYPTHGSSTPLRIVRLEPSRRTSFVASIPPSRSGAPLRDVNGLAAGADGALYYTENRAIRRIDGSGRVSTIVDDLGCSGRRARGEGPDPLLRGLDVGPGGIIYVAATGCRSVFRVTPRGQVTSLPQLASVWSPTGVAIHGSDLYVLEFEHGDAEDRRQMLPRIRKISADGSTAIVATVSRH